MKRVLTLLLLVRASLLVAAAAPPTWSVLIRTNVTGSPAAVINMTSGVGFVQIQAPSGATLTAGTVITITNATATLSNGIGYATVVLSSNDWKELTSVPGISSNQWNITITPP